MDTPDDLDLSGPVQTRRVREQTNGKGFRDGPTRRVGVDGTSW